ncbi:uncharacterized protein [Engystomops pustulosus]|uniref:uncharacterized protein isoform X1 n=1 Tax=Engystomops pustulosus TaxID=76066 RepID=UPI003AFA7035
MLLDHDRGLLNQQRELIKKLESRLISFDTTSLVEPFRKKLKEMIEGYEKNIILTKQNKLQRDKKDYERGRAYHWTHRGNKRRHYPPAPRSHAIGGTNLIDTQSSENSESENSQDDASTSSHNARKRGPRHRDWSPSYKREKTRRGKKESREGESTGLQVINLSSYNLSDIELSVLRKGLSFSPMNKLNKFEVTKDVYLFCRQLAFKLLYHQPDLVDSLPEGDRQTFRDLLDLLEEASNDSDITN